MRLMAASMFIIVIDTTIMNVSISALVVDLNTTVGGIQAAISLYALVMASFMLIGGKLADIVGKKRIFLLGLVIFGTGTTIASFANNLAVLIFGWSILEGIGSALMMPNTQTILRDEYDGADRARAYGLLGAVSAIAAAVGPIAGGFLTTYFSWRWAFRLEVLIVVAVLVFSRAIKKDVLPERRPKFDFVGAVLSFSGWSLIVLGILLAQNYGFFIAKQPLVIGSWSIAPFGLSVVPFLVGIGSVLVLCLFRWEKRRAEKQLDGLFDPAIFRIEGIVSGFSTRFVQMGVSASFLFLFPLLLQLTFEYTAIQTGLALMPMSIGVLIFAILGARLSARFTAKRIIQVGFLLVIAGLIYMITTVQPGIDANELASGAVFGAGIGLIASQILNLILSSVKPEDTPEATGLNGTFEQLGNAFGVALVGTIMIATLMAGVTEGVSASTTIPAQLQVQLINAVEQGIELVSDTQVQTALAQAGVPSEAAQELGDIYTDSRLTSFRAAMVFLVFVSLAGLVLTTGLTDKKLVEQEQIVI